jgi:hypothetical protein
MNMEQIRTARRERRRAIYEASKSEPREAVAAAFNIGLSRFKEVVRRERKGELARTRQQQQKATADALLHPTMNCARMPPVD